MKVYSYILLFTGAFFMVFATNVCFAQKSDSISSLSSEKILELKTEWSNSNNAAGFSYYNIQHKIGKAGLSYNHEKGDFHRFQEATEEGRFGFNTEGYVHVKSWKLYGQFNYFKQNENGIKWVDVMEPYNNNPYTLGDAGGGKYQKEYFIMQGKAAYPTKHNLVFGFDVNYKTGIGARRKDPRPENTLTNFDVKPGIVWQTGSLKIGGNLHYQTGKEDIELTTVTDSIYDFYHYKGLGAFTSTTEQDNRSSESELFGGGFQFNFLKGSLSNLTELNFYKKSTDIKRGKTFPLQVVLLDEFNTSIYSVFMFGRQKQKIKKLTLSFNEIRLYGNEPVVEPKLEQFSYQWLTVAKYTLLWDKQQKYAINYRYYKLSDNNHFNWGGEFSGKYFTSNSKYYFVPEFNQQNLNYFLIDGLLEKEWKHNSANWIVSILSAYRKGVNSSIKITDDKFLLETINRDFVEHDFSYYNSAMFMWGGNIQFGKKIYLYSNPAQFFISAGYKRYQSKLGGTSSRNVFSINTGFNF